MSHPHHPTGNGQQAAQTMRGGTGAATGAEAGVASLPPPTYEEATITSPRQTVPHFIPSTRSPAAPYQPTKPTPTAPTPTAPRPTAPSPNAHNPPTTPGCLYPTVTASPYPNTTPYPPTVTASPYPNTTPYPPTVTASPYPNTTPYPPTGTPHPSTPAYPDPRKPCLYPNPFSTTPTPIRISKAPNAPHSGPHLPPISHAVSENIVNESSVRQSHLAGLSFRHLPPGRRKNANYLRLILVPCAIAIFIVVVYLLCRTFFY